jgi:hypothetical protein
MLKVCFLTCTSGRHTLLERVVRCFLEQDYENKVMLIFQNSEVEQQLDESLLDKNIILVNQHLDSKTGLPYTNLGSIYNDAIKFIPEDVDVVNCGDDDDFYLSNHLSEGIRGYERAAAKGQVAYKPKFSYFRHAGGIQKMCNVFEPSIFVCAKHLKQYGCHENTTNQHHKWLDAVGSNMTMEEDGISTLIYDWRSPVPCFKTSGNPHGQQNFNNYRNFSKEHGDKIISPCNKEVVELIYKEVAECGKQS